MSRYRETLDKWAAKRVPEGATNIVVEVINDPGYKYSSYTMEDPHVDVVIYYSLFGERFSSGADVENLGEILTELFAIEDEDDAA